MTEKASAMTQVEESLIIITTVLCLDVVALTFRDQDEQGQSDAFKGMSSKMITGGMKHIWDADIAKALAELESRR